MSKISTDIESFAPSWLYIIDKYQNKQLLKLNDVQLAIHRNRRGKDLILKPRQKGVSTYVQALFYHLAITQTVNTATLAHDDDTTQRFRRMVDRYHEGITEIICEKFGVDQNKLTGKELSNLPVPRKHFSNATVSTYPEFQSECYIATAGSVQKGRGGTYSHVHGSEVAFWKDPQKIVSGLMQGGNPQIFLESTPNGAQGYFYQLCMEVLAQNENWKDDLIKNRTFIDGLDWRLHFFTWFFDNEYSTPLEKDEVITPSDIKPYGFMSELELMDYAASIGYTITPEQIKWRRRKIRDLKHEFIQEYPEDVTSCFLLSGIGYFGDIRDKVQKTDTKHSPLADHRYYAGLDFGQSNDYTVLSIIDKNSKQQVDMLRINHMSWSDMRRRIMLKCKEWNVKTLLAEKNSIGSVNIEELKKEFVAKDENGVQNCKTKIMDFDTTNQSKAEIMSNLHEAIHEVGLSLLNNEFQTHELQAYQRDYTTTGKPKLNAPEGEHDDTVIALALAWHCAMYFGRTLIH